MCGENHAGWRRSCRGRTVAGTPHETCIDADNCLEVARLERSDADEIGVELARLRLRGHGREGTRKSGGANSAPPGPSAGIARTAHPGGRVLSHVTDHTNPPRKGDAGWAAPRFGVRVLTAVARIPVTVVRRRCCRTRDALYGVVLRSVLRSPEGVAEAVPRPRNGIGMAMQIAGHAWVLVAPKAALVRRERLWTEVPDGFALLEVLGCGVCHTDLGFADGEVAHKQELPLVPGHEGVGRVLAAGAGGAQRPLGKRILAPAVSPCGCARRADG